MTTKIFQNTVLIAILVIILCTAMFLGILYGYFEDQVFDELASEAALAGHGFELEGQAYLEGVDTGNRITLVAPDGTVLYDSLGNEDEMENHRNREEITEALENGTGAAARYSQIYLAKSLYYATRLSDGNVLRICCEQYTVMALLFDMITPLIWILLAALVLSGILASRLAKRITKPINELNLDHPSLNHTYKELAPLLSRIRQQNQTIQQQINELSSRQRQFSAITENMSEGFLLIDNRTNVLSYNSSALRILGATPTQELRSVLQLNRSHELREAVDSALAGEHTETLLNVSERCYQLIGNPVSANGQVTGAVLLVLDVTEREQREDLRREFTANVSHELKTPLTSISGFAELMMNGLVGETQVREFAGDIYSESRRLISLVEDIINLSQLDEQPHAPEREPVDLYALSADVLQRLAPAAAKRNITLTLAGESSSVNGSQHILDEMVCNLCDNAIKYNRENGSVTVSVTKEAGHVKLLVSDTGIGIPAAHQARIFERFYRVDKSHSKQIGGTGLGLSIVKHGAQYHDAQVSLESEENRGTTITITF